MGTEKKRNGWRVLGISVLIVAASGVVLYVGFWALIAFTFRGSGTYNKHPTMLEASNYEAPKSEVWWDIVDSHVTLYFTDCQVHHVTKLALSVSGTGPVKQGEVTPLDADLRDVVVPPKGLRLETVLPGSDPVPSSPAGSPTWAASVIDVQGGIKTGQISLASLNDGSIDWSNMSSGAVSTSADQHQKVQACPRR